MMLQTSIKLKGLDPNSIYTDNETNKQYYGSQLMQFGLHIEASSNTNDYYSVVVNLR